MGLRDHVRRVRMSRLVVRGKLVRALTAVIAAGVLSAFASVVPAEGFVYWVNGPPTATIGRADLDGANPNPSFIPGSGSGPFGVAVDDFHIYWTNESLDVAYPGTIGRANLDGSNIDQNFIVVPGPLPWVTSVAGIAVDAKHIYWTDRAGDRIGRANLDGSNVDPNFITDAPNPGGIAVDTQHIYWAVSGRNTIARADLDGSNINQRFIGTLPNAPLGLAVDSSHIYWTGRGSPPWAIGRANLDGSSVDPTFFTAASEPISVAVDADHLYWSSSITASIGRAAIDGANPNADFITGATNPLLIAVDSIDAPSTAGCDARGVGRMIAANGDRAKFSVAVRAASASTVTGMLAYDDDGPVSPMKLVPTGVNSLVCQVGRATIRGQGDLAGQPVHYRVDLTDGHQGKSDSYRIQLSNGYDSGDQNIESGNIRIVP